MLVAVCKNNGRVFFFFLRNKETFFLCELEKLHSLQQQIMQPNAHSFGLMIACLSVGYLTPFQTESYEQQRDAVVLKHISHDARYALSTI